MKAFMICCSLLLVSIAAEGAKPLHPIYGKEAKLVQHPKNVQIYAIDAFPVLSIEQVTGEQYICDYRIRMAVPYTKNQLEVLQSSLLDTASYVVPETRKCPFTGTYALVFQKGKQQLVIVLSNTDCPKAVIFCAGSAIDKKHIDLSDNGTILLALRNITPEKPKATP